MTHEEHRERHERLHSALDELFADYIQHHPDQHNFTKMPFDQFLKWSHAQTVNPTEST